MPILKRCIIKIKINVVTQSRHVQQTLFDVLKSFYRTPTHNPFKLSRDVQKQIARMLRLILFRMLQVHDINTH